METFVPQEQPWPLQQMHCLSMFTNPALPPMSTNPEKHQSLCDTGKESSILVKDHAENCGSRKAVKASSRGGTLRYDISALPCIRKCDKLASGNLLFRACQHNVFTCQASGRADEKTHLVLGGTQDNVENLFQRCLNSLGMTQYPRLYLLGNHKSCQTGVGAVLQCDTD